MPQSSTAGQFSPALPEAPRAPAGARLASIPRDTLRTQRLPLGAGVRPEAGLEALFGNPRRLARRDVLYRTGDAFSALYLVRVGSFKSVTLVDDGREQITGYSMAGDMVGLEGLGLANHTSDVVALEDSEVSALPFARLDQATRDPEMLQALFQRLASSLQRGQELSVLLGSLSAEERVATFLLDLAHRHWLCGEPANGAELVLRMTREEIASFLGLQLETVSRTFSRLHAEGVISVRGRTIALLDTAGLRRIAGHDLTADADSHLSQVTGAEHARRSR